MTALMAPDLAAFPNRATNELVGVAPVMVRRQVEFGECDPAGIVYTPRFADYLLGAFHWFMAVLFRDVGRDVMPEATPMRGLELDFRRMLFPGDWFVMAVHVTAIRTRSFDLAIVGQDQQGSGIFLGRLSPIATDRASNQAVVLPRLLRSRLEAYRDSYVVPEGIVIPRP